MASAMKVASSVWPTTEWAWVALLAPTTENGKEAGCDRQEDRKQRRHPIGLEIARQMPMPFGINSLTACGAPRKITSLAEIRMPQRSPKAASPKRLAEPLAQATAQSRHQNGDP